MSIKLLPKDLDNLASAPQGLDGQYVPLRYLNKRKSLTEIKYFLEEEVQSEYFRSLIYSPQVVLNRAYLFNTPSIYRDFLKESPNRDIFLDFLENRWIIPWLYKENTFKEPPAFSTDKKGWEATSGLEGDIDIPYLRLSWDEDENIKKVNRLSREFTGYVMRMVMVSELIAHSLGIENTETIENFSKKLNEVGKYCYEIFDNKKRKFITRDDMYQKFICREGTKTVEGHYDYEKEFSKELKMLFDLKYNVNLPDSLGIQTLTGVDLPDRSALQEISLIIATSESKNYDIDLTDLFSNISLNKLSNGMWINSINNLSLKEIHQIRNTPEFDKFISEMRIVRKAANDVITKKKNNISLENFSIAFSKYQKAIAGISEKKFIEEVQPSIELAIKIGGILLSIAPVSQIIRVSGSAIAKFDKKISEFSAKIIAKGRKKRQIHDASICCDLLNSTLIEPKDQIIKFLDRMKKDGYTLEYPDYFEMDNGTLEEPPSDYELPDYQ